MVRECSHAISRGRALPLAISGNENRSVYRQLYSDVRRQPAAQFWACIWSLQRSALVQSPKSRYPSGRPLMNHTTTARPERGPITA